MTVKRTVKNCSSPDCSSEHLSRACERKDCNVDVCLNAQLPGGYCSENCKEKDTQLPSQQQVVNLSAKDVILDDQK